MKRYHYIILSSLLVAGLLIVGSWRALKWSIPFYLGRQLNADVRIERLSWRFPGGVTARSISISNKRGLRCSIEEATIDYAIILIIKHGLSFDFRLKGVTLSYKSSNLINSIAEALSIKPLDVFRFDSVKGEFYQRREEVIIKSLVADGSLIKLFADGTIVRGSSVDYSFRMLLSERLIATMPDSVREVFFKREGEWSEIELYITGDIDRPSINFSTDLFKLIVR